MMMSDIPHRAKVFIVAVMLIAAAVTTYAIGTRMGVETRSFVVMLAMAIVAARLKLTLPGFDSAMSMNLPFMLLAIAQLPLPEAIAVGAVSTFVQTLPRSGQTVKAEQAVFNVCNMVNAIAIASLLTARAGHVEQMNTSFLIATAAMAFFFADTVPVAAIMSMTSTSRLMEIWVAMAIMTFPYFVLSAGLACLVATGFQVIGWTAGAVTLGVMLGVYRCFRFYLGHGSALKPDKAAVPVKAVPQPVAGD